MRKIVFLTIIFSFSVATVAQKQNSIYLNYIEKFHGIAEVQQREHGIPASITLAQGLLESGAGLSRLAVEAHNHFGIKCHGWQGAGVYKDDDLKNECFRKYKTATDSYKDHSAFLVNGKRYASLFTLNPTDYEQWAHGLKKAGYATDPTYAYKLISIIEDYELHRFDRKKSAQPRIDPKTRKAIYEKSEPVDYQEFSMGVINPYSEHEILTSNGVKFVVATKGDTYGSIADELRISEKKLRQYNEVESNTALAAGQRVYIKSKKNKATKGIDTYTVRRGDSMYSIAQEFGVKIKSLYDMNKMQYSEGAKEGRVLKIR
ncbi:MAG: glucosaminidase domain-containing protein [Prevotellaceae bacterium]|nr:glucosaminidase domain-containing protein [Prevotellaceae bacterium]